MMRQLARVQKIRCYATDSKAFLEAVEYQARLQNLALALQKDGRDRVPFSDFVSIVQQQLNVTQQQAEELIPVFHKAGSYLRFADKPELSQVVFVKPQVVTQALLSQTSTASVPAPIQQLVQQAQALQEQITVLDKIKNELDAKARTRAKGVLTVAAGYLTLQMTMFAKWTWIDYGWDVVEPYVFNNILIFNLLV